MRKDRCRETGFRRHGCILRRYAPRDDNETSWGTNSHKMDDARALATRKSHDMSIVSLSVSLLATCLVLFASVHAQAPAAAPPIANLPATFEGTWPCADCPRIRYRLNLLPNDTFASRMIYEERSTHADAHGKWELANDGKTLVLRGQHGPAEQYELPDSETLRKLDVNGHEIQSNLNSDLKRAPKFMPIDDKGHPPVRTRPIK